MTDDTTNDAGAKTRARVHVPIHLRWGDLDAFNHVNNTSMLKLLEEARVRAFWRSDEAGESPSTAILDTQDAESDTLTLVARQEIEYLAPVPYGRRPLDIQLWIGRLGGSSIDACFEVYSPAGEGPQTLYARAIVVIVLVDRHTGRPRRLTDEMRAAWDPFVDDSIAFSHRR